MQKSKYKTNNPLEYDWIRTHDLWIGRRGHYHLAKSALAYMNLLNVSKGTGQLLARELYVQQPLCPPHLLPVAYLLQSSGGKVNLLKDRGVESRVLLLYRTFT